MPRLPTLPLPYSLPPPVQSPIPLSEVSPEDMEGRVDVLAFKAAEKVAKAVEKRYGLEGLWGCLEGMVEEGFTEYLGDRKVEIPGMVREWLENRG